MSYMPQEQINVNYKEREKREARTFEKNNVIARSTTPSHAKLVQNVYGEFQ